MNIRNFLCYFLAISILSTSSIAQKTTKIKDIRFLEKRVEVGDTISSFVINNVKNYKSKSLRLTDFKGKFLILDFWGVYCAPCIKAIPEMEELQEKLDHKIQVILITKNSNSEIEKLGRNSSIVKNISLPMVNGDTILSRLFPYLTIPTHVWINEKGIVSAITEGYNTNYTSISRALVDGVVNVAEKKEEPNYRLDEPLLNLEAKKANTSNYYSILTGRMTEWGGGGESYYFDSSTNRIIGVKVINQSVIDLLKIAFSEGKEGRFEDNNRVILDVKNLYKYWWPTNMEDMDAWKADYLYCYEMKVPVQKSSDIFILMQANLLQYFDKLIAFKEKRKTQCLIVSLVDSSKLKSRGGERILKINEVDNYRNTFIQNRPINDFFEFGIGSPNLGLAMPVINNTNFKGNIDLKIRPSLMDIDAVISELSKFGLIVTKEDREIEFLIIRDKQTFPRS